MNLESILSGVKKALDDSVAKIRHEFEKKTEAIKKENEDLKTANEDLKNENQVLSNDVNNLKSSQNQENTPITNSTLVTDNISENLSDKPNEVSVGEIKDALDELIEANIKDDNLFKAIDNINNPKVATKVNKEELDKFGMTKTSREWAMRYIFKVEGGYFNHPNDPGGETMYGIIIKEARANGYTGAMRNLPKEVAMNIYQVKYWKNQNLQSINHFGKQLCIFDFIVNSGNRGIKMAQKSINRLYATRYDVPENTKIFEGMAPLLEDGKLGPKTIECINRIPFELFYTSYITAQMDCYHELIRNNSNLRSFEDGWENRIHRKNQFIYRLISDGIITSD